MSRVAAARPGAVLTVKGRPIPYSNHPVVRTNRRYGLQSRIFSTNPWGIIGQSIEDKLTGVSRDQAIAFVAQAENFYRTSQTSTLLSAKPLLIYYFMLNLAKAFVLHTRLKATYEKAQHGIEENIHPNGIEFVNSFLKVYRSKPSSVNVFDDFQGALFGKKAPSSGKVFDLQHLLPQLLQGHRVWCEATDADERFVEITRIQYMHDENSKSIWLTLEIYADDLSRFGITRKRMLQEAGLSNTFKEVRGTLVDGRNLLTFEQITPLRYTGRASDKIHELVGALKRHIWSTVIKIHPYRKNYLYLCPADQQQSLMEQILSVYACFYYLGSVTRYRPHLFESIIEGKFGGHINEIITNLPQQFLYLLASEFASREIAHAPLV
ncbi:MULTISPECIES: YaaC family protein [Achromobacter]|uniref:YaaC family protein n=1 Tax=Achromobacter TaxID=222 RepID=UPI0009F9F160|nr:YaaC family protein [Achromobacter spanius]